MHICAHYHETSYDFFILVNSFFPAIFQEVPPLEGWLFGDNGYSVKTLRITPYIISTKACAVIVITSGLPEMRFRCLNSSGWTLQYSLQKVGELFVASGVLHNIAMHQRCVLDLLPDLGVRCEAELQVPMSINLNIRAAARALRDWWWSCIICSLVSNWLALCKDYCI